MLWGSSSPSKEANVPPPNAREVSMEAGKREQRERRPKTSQGFACLPEGFLPLRPIRSHRRI